VRTKHDDEYHATGDLIRRAVGATRRPDRDCSIEDLCDGYRSYLSRRANDPPPSIDRRTVADYFSRVGNLERACSALGIVMVSDIDPDRISDIVHHLKKHHDTGGAMIVKVLKTFRLMIERRGVLPGAAWQIPHEEINAQPCEDREIDSE